MTRTHTYEAAVTWTGNRGTGTSGYREYDRTHEVAGDGRDIIAGSADPAFRGDPARWNPEQLLVASLSQCHLLWYLHLAAEAGVVVTGYVDAARGTMVEDRPEVTVAEPDMTERAQQLHEQASALCFIARSVNFPVRHESTVTVATSSSTLEG